MSEENKKKLVVMITCGTEHEKSSVGFTIANGGLTAGLDVNVFLSSGGVDLVRKRAVDMTHMHPLEHLKELVDAFLKRGGKVWACTPCVKARGYEQEDLLDGVIITGASPMLEEVKQGAATLSF